MLSRTSQGSSHVALRITAVSLSPLNHAFLNPGAPAGLPGWKPGVELKGRLSFPGHFLTMLGTGD